MVGLDGEDGLDVQWPVEVDSDHGQGHVTALHHNMEEMDVLEVLQEIAPVALIHVPVS